MSNTPGYVSNSDLAHRLSTLVDRWNRRENQMIALLTQEEGTVIVTDGLGVNHELPSFPQLQKDVTAMTDELTGVLPQVQDIAGTVTTLASAAEQSALTAEQYASDAQAASEGVAQFADAAALSAADAANSATAAAEDAADAYGSRLAAESAAATVQSLADSAGSAAGVATAAAGAAEGSANDAAGSASAAASSATAASTAAASAATSANSADAAADAADTSAGAAADSASAAATSASNAANSASTAASHRTAAEAARSAAEAARGDTLVAASDAAAAASLAALWASADEDVPVEDGYSAKHWAIQAQNAASGAMTYKGAWDADSGAFPANPETGHMYVVRTAGTVEGIEFAIGDSIVYNGVEWERIPNVQAVTSVAGKTGDVTLAAGDIASGTFAEARIPALPVSKVTGLQGALDGKAPASHGHDIDDVDGLQDALDGKAAASHNHSASNITSGTLPVARGGTGKTSYTAGNFLYASASSAVGERTPAQVLTDIGAAAASHTHAAGDITSGTLNAARIPTLAISKVSGLQDALDGKAAASHSHSAGDITSGTLNAARIPTLAISKVSGLQTALDGKADSSHTHAAGDITTGTFAAARIPNLAASKITSGTLSDDRLPSTMSGKTFTSAVTVQGSVSSTGYLYASGGRIYGNDSAGGDTHILNGNTTGHITIRPKGWNTSGQTVFRNNGQIDTSGNINLRGAILSRAGENQLRVTTSFGYFQAGPNNNSWCHLSTDRDAFHFNKEVAFGGGATFYNGPRIPKMFVQSGDPGSSASTGDLWIW